jgi:hypothetical protein
MKISDIVCEHSDLEEAPVGFLRRKGQTLGRYLGSQSAAGAEAVSTEANDLKRQLKKYMGGAGIKTGQLTIDQLETFLNQAGYGGIAAGELTKMRQAQQQKSDARSQKIQKFGQRVGAGISAIGAGAKAMGSEYRRRAPQESMYEQETAPLTNAEVDKILLSVVKSAYARGPEVKRGRFGKSVPAAKTKDAMSANVQQILQSLSADEKNQLKAALAGTKAPGASTSTAGSAPGAKKSIAAGTTATASDGAEYVWQGAAWKNSKTGRIAKRNIAQELSAAA